MDCIFSEEYLYLGEHSSVVCKYKISTSTNCREDPANTCSCDAIVPRWRIDSCRTRVEFVVSTAYFSNLFLFIKQIKLETANGKKWLRAYHLLGTGQRL